jgi:glucose-1-phosphate thymidylyltransferase
MPIGNVPVIAHVVSDLAAGGVRRAQIIAAAGERGPLERALGAGAASGLPIEIVEAPPAGSRREVLHALCRGLAHEPVLLVPGDGLAPHLLGQMPERYDDGDVDVVLATRGPVVVRAGPHDGRLRDLPLVLGPGAGPLIAGLLESDGGDGDLTGVLLHSGLRLAVCDAGDDTWLYDSSTDVLLAGNRRALDRLPAGPPLTELGEGNELHGRISVGEGVFASGCVIQGPAAIAAHAVLEDCHIGPFTAIGPRAVISDAELDDTIVLADAEIRHPGQRIVMSVIGERARVGRRFALPRGLHLRLGPDSRIDFS